MLSAPQQKTISLRCARCRTAVRQTGSTQWPDWYGVRDVRARALHCTRTRCARRCRPDDVRRVCIEPSACALERAFGAHGIAHRRRVGRCTSTRVATCAVPSAFHELRRTQQPASAARTKARSGTSLARWNCWSMLEPSALRDEFEINVQIGLGNVLMQTGGWAAAMNVQAAYARAVGSVPQARRVPNGCFPALWNLWVFNAASGGLDRAHAAGHPAARAGVRFERSGVPAASTPCELDHALLPWRPHWMRSAHA